jgi:hypothetical protein
MVDKILATIAFAIFLVSDLYIVSQSNVPSFELFIGIAALGGFLTLWLLEVSRNAKVRKGLDRGGSKSRTVGSSSKISVD